MRGTPRATWPARFPLLRLDHVWIGKSIRVAGVSVPRDALTRTASDHLPIVADLVIEPSGVVTPQANILEERAS
ncbi:MAG: endonuclease/exonuclease/phosphatase family protein [Polyangiaceae bacterium]